MEVSPSKKIINCGVSGSGSRIRNCLICYSDDLRFSKNKKCTTLEKHLDVILILKQIFELDSEQLQEYLVKYPDNVDKWISVCGKCRKLIDKYKNIQRKLFKVKLKLIKIAKCSFNEGHGKSKKTKGLTEQTEVDGDHDDFENHSQRQSGLSVTEKSRQFIRERDYDSRHKFIPIPATATTTDHFKVCTAADDNPTPKEDKINDIEDKFDGDDGTDDFFDSADNELSPPNFPSSPSPQTLPGRKIRPRPELIIPIPNAKDIDQDWLPDSDGDSDISNDNFDSSQEEDDVLNSLEVEIADIKPSLPVIPSPKVILEKTCHLCEKTFHDKSTLTRHLINIHKQPIVRKPKKCFGTSTKCSICSKKFSTPSLLHYHQQFTHLKQFDIRCSICFKGFRTSKDLKYHEKVCQSKASGRSMLSCHYEGCKARYWNEDGLQKHLELHEKGVSWQCYQCGKSFLSEGALKSHEKLYHGKDGVEPEEVICEFCGDKFATKLSLSSHKRISLKCQLNYQKKPEAECKLTCDICGDKFGSQRALSMHVDTRHLNKYPFNCGEEGCEKGFVQKSKLTYHLKKVHGIGEYPWKCEVEGCGMGYDSKRVLEEHMSTHGGERKYECGDCGKRFYFQRGLVGHRKKVHAIQSGGQSVQCNLCGRGFKSLVYLRCHLKSCHGIGNSVYVG